MDFDKCIIYNYHSSQGVGQFLHPKKFSCSPL